MILLGEYCCQPWKPLMCGHIVCVPHCACHIICALLCVPHCVCHIVCATLCGHRARIPVYVQCVAAIGNKVTFHIDQQLSWDWAHICKLRKDQWSGYCLLVVAQDLRLLVSWLSVVIHHFIAPRTIHVFIVGLHSIAVSVFVLILVKFNIQIRNTSKKWWWDKQECIIGL